MVGPIGHDQYDPILEELTKGQDLKEETDRRKEINGLPLVPLYGEKMFFFFFFYTREENPSDITD